jgi:hypothetical protein
MVIVVGCFFSTLYFTDCFVAGSKYNEKIEEDTQLYNLYFAVVE